MLFLKGGTELGDVKYVSPYSALFRRSAVGQAEHGQVVELLRILHEVVDSFVDILQDLLRRRPPVHTCQG